MVLYIDPGTGSMLFTLAIGVSGAVVYSIRSLIMKLKFSSGKTQKDDGNRYRFVIFSDSKRYWTVFRPICEEFEKREVPLHYMTMSEDDPVLSQSFKYITSEFIGSGNSAFARLNFLHADVVVSTTPGLDVYQWKRSRDVKKYVHILHAAGDASLYRMFGLDYYDALLFSGDFQVRQIRELEKKRNLPAKQIELTGLPYMDDMSRRLAQAAPPAKTNTEVLLAPSWGPSGILTRFGEKIIDALLDTGYHITVRPHPQSFVSEKEMIERLMQKYPDSDRMEWNRDNDNFEVLRRSDILISDFSGVMFEFALVYDRPVIYTRADFDDAIYDACWIDEEIWEFQVLPKLGLELTEDGIAGIGDMIRQCLSDDVFANGRKEARDEVWCCRGTGREKTVDCLLRIEEEGKERKTAGTDADRQ